MSKGGKLFAPVIMQKMGREENVVIKCFKTPKCYYFYDRNTDSIVKITRGQYELLKNVEQEKHYDHILALEGLFAQGFLKTSIVEKIEHPETKSIKFLSDNYVHMLLLQVTQQCNLRCSYCAYSGNYNNRIHDSQKMNFNTAQNAIDFYFYHSKNREELSIGFYGGEPLIEFSLIKKCVEYCEEHKSGKEINYRVTTNGTLINDVIIDFFIKYNFSVTISLDGDKEAHDKNRKFRDGRGSFDLILKNLSKIREKNDWFYGNNIFFNTVVDPKVSIDSMQKFFNNKNIFIDGHMRYSLIASTGVKDKELVNYTNQNWNSRYYEYLKLLLHMLSEIDLQYVDALTKVQKIELKTSYLRLHNRKSISKIMHHGGPCVPGIHRLFVTIHGDFFPCERVSESADFFNIGNIESGYDYDKIRKILNVGYITREECLKCWNLTQCAICAASIEVDEEGLSRKSKLSECENSKKNALLRMREVCILKELGCKMMEE